MATVRDGLSRYGVRIARARLVAGAGGNISAREGDIIWMKPSGLAMDEIGPDDWCGMDLKTGQQVRGDKKPTSEVSMHLEIYRARPDLRAVFHTHSPWASGVITAGKAQQARFAERARGLGRVTTIPYITPTTHRLAAGAAEAARGHDTVLMVNHGVLAFGVTMEEAFDKCVLAEAAALSMVAAAVAKRPRFLSMKQQAELVKLGAAGC